MSLTIVRKKQSIQIHPFAISNYNADPVGFIIAKNGKRIGLATDLDIATPLEKKNLKGCHLLIFEANHDPDMLPNSTPWPLKQHIQSRIGHLSNKPSQNLLMALQHSRFERVILAHLSETNNAPHKVLNEVSKTLTLCKPRLTIVSQQRSSDVIYPG